MDREGVKGTEQTKGVTKDTAGKVKYKKLQSEEKSYKVKGVQVTADLKDAVKDSNE